MSQVKEKKKKSGGFQSMGLSADVLKGILKKGYKVPTPIQRKTIPVILEGKDVVAMARTGSGKTAAFLVPMFEKVKKLKVQTSKPGVRALVFSPTRELAMQTMKFTKELGKHLNLKAILVLGGENMEGQFAAIHENPDIIIATPGRFLHVVMEMDLKLSSIEYIVFDEADRLFEMGFQEQIEEVLHRLPEHRQTLLFSATLPRMLIDFVKAGLNDPVLIRLDVGQLSGNLKTAYLCCRSDDKPHILIRLLRTVVDTSKELTVVFLATRHHIEYIKEILEKASIPCSYIYSSLDQMARKINVAKFKTKKVGVLLVTDIAARGIDIPLLDNVINYNFPSKPKLFVHRVGRVARAGRSGNAYSLVGPDEIPYLIDLHLFLGKPIKFPDRGNNDENGLCGYVPQALIDEEADMLRLWHESSHDLRSMAKVCSNAYKQYVKTRPLPSSESIKRVKEVSEMTSKYHPIFTSTDVVEMERNKMLSDVKNYRPNSTIFEIGATAKCQGNIVMRLKRQQHDIIEKIRSIKHESIPEEVLNLSTKLTAGQDVSDAADDATIESTFNTIVSTQKSKSKGSVKKKKDKFKDDEYYIPYFSKENYSEKGLGLQSSFDQQASGAVLDLTGDDVQTSQKLKNSFQWDRKRKRFVKNDGSEFRKKMKTESGVWIPKSYKSDLYKKWKEKSKIGFQENNDSEDDGESQFGKRRKGMKGKFNINKNNKLNKHHSNELKTKEQILKERKRKARLMSHQKKRQTQKKQKIKNRGVNRKR